MAIAKGTDARRQSPDDQDRTGSALANRVDDRVFGPSPVHGALIYFLYRKAIRAHEAKPLGTVSEMRALVGLAVLVYCGLFNTSIASDRARQTGGQTHLHMTPLNAVRAVGGEKLNLRSEVDHGPLNSMRLSQDQRPAFLSCHGAPGEFSHSPTESRCHTGRCHTGRCHTSVTAFDRSKENLCPTDTSSNRPHWALPIHLSEEAVRTERKLCAGGSWKRTPAISRCHTLSNTFTLKGSLS